MRLQLLTLLVLPFVASAATDEQMVLSGPDKEPFVPVVNSGKPSLADLLTIESTASIFYSYARELEISQLFSDPNARSTVLVPTNKAVIALPRKPHEDSQPLDDGVILSEAEFDAMSKKNVERWVSAHIIPRSPISLATDGEYATLLSGKNVTFTFTKGDANTPEWTHALLDGSVHLIDMKEASNGVLYLLDGTVKLD
ncbi:hypothetical protein LXA43DRAFT_1092960 [Ganoderma leucocontextum]|nr:hypothetical protein LXA43DRAFT_1092960 [Ganoderma leucocontextum]